MTSCPPKDISEIDLPEDVRHTVESATPELAPAVDLLQDRVATSEGH